MFRNLTAIALTMIATTGFAEVVTIEGFENTDDPANWQVNLTPTHTHNMQLNGFQVPEYVSTNVTEGIRAGRFHSLWDQTSGTAVSNPYDPSGPLLYWAVRYNVNAPSSLPNNMVSTVDGVLEADFANESPYPMQVALVVDTATDSDLERGPLVTIDANSTGTYSWDFATQPPVGFDTGDGVITGNARLKSLLIYTPTTPTTNDLDITVDNIRNNTPVDMVAPATPKPLSFEQGASTGQAILRWQAVGDTDLASYNVYISSDAQWNSPILNRLSFPASPEATVAGGVQTVTLTGLPTGQNVYATISAVDNAPLPNESNKSLVLAANLEADGSSPLDSLVLDLDEFQPGSAEFTNNAYFPAAVYTAQALDGLGRTFDTVTADAIASNQALLSVDPAGVVVWSNMMDGSSIAGGSISTTNLAKIQSFINAGGNLIVSGNSVAQDVNTAPGGLSAYLKATLVSGNIGISEVDPVGPLSTVPQLSTALNPATASVAFATSSNDGILPSGGSVAVSEYDGVPSSNAVAGVGYSASLVFLGFAFESAGNLAQPASSPLTRQELMGAMVEYLVGETAAADWHLFN